MSYSNSNRAVLKVESYLRSMLERDSEVSWITDNPTKLAYQLREGMKVAELKSNLFKEFAGLRKKYIIKTTTRKVIAALRSPGAVVEQPSIEGFKETIDAIVNEDVSTLIEIVGAAIANKSAAELYFPNALLNEDELLRLYNWTSVNEYHIIVGDGITLTKRESGEFAWKPQLASR